MLDCGCSVTGSWFWCAFFMGSFFLLVSWLTMDGRFLELFEKLVFLVFFFGWRRLSMSLGLGLLKVWYGLLG